MYANEAADKLAGAGAQMEAVEDIIVHVSGAMTNLMICMRGNRRYVSHSVCAEGFRQAQVRLSGLGQQGVAAVLRRSIGGSTTTTHTQRACGECQQCVVSGRCCSAIF